MNKLLTAVLESLLKLNPTVTVVLAVCTFLTTLAMFLSEMYATVKAKLLLLILPDAVEGQIIGVFNFFDYCLPVSELFGFVALWLGVSGLCVLIRIVKSWIPTMN